MRLKYTIDRIQIVNIETMYLFKCNNEKWYENNYDQILINFKFSTGKSFTELQK